MLRRSRPGVGRASWSAVAGVPLLGVGELLAAGLADVLDALAGAAAGRRGGEGVSSRATGGLRRRTGFVPRRLASPKGRLVALVRRQVIAAIGELVRKVLLLDVGAFEVVRIAISDTDAVLLHPAMGGVSEVERDRQRPAAFDVTGGRPVGEPGPVRLRRPRAVGRRLGEGVLRLREADPVERVARGDRDLEGSRIGIPDVLAGTDDQPPGDELRVLAGGDHGREPVESG